MLYYTLMYVLFASVTDWMIFIQCGKCGAFVTHSFCTARRKWSQYADLYKVSDARWHHHLRSSVGEFSFLWVGLRISWTALTSWLAGCLTSEFKGRISWVPTSCFSETEWTCVSVDPTRTTVRICWTQVRLTWTKLFIHFVWVQTNTFSGSPFL